MWELYKIKLSFMSIYNHWSIILLLGIFFFVKTAVVKTPYKIKLELIEYAMGLVLALFKQI